MMKYMVNLLNANITHMKESLFSLLIIFKCTVICMFVCGCNFGMNKTLNCEKFNQIIVSDQLYREDVRTNPIAFLIDSLSGGDKSKLDLFFDEAAEIYMSRKESTHYTRGFINRELADSLDRLQTKIDIKNVKTIHRYLEKVELNRIDTLECFRDVIIILAHTPKELMPKTKSLLEKKKSFINTVSFTYLKRRLNF